MPQNKIEHVKKSVIENKLLAALDDETKVAILCTEHKSGGRMSIAKIHAALKSDDRIRWTPLTQ